MTVDKRVLSVSVQGFIGLSITLGMFKPQIYKIPRKGAENDDAIGYIGPMWVSKSRILRTTDIYLALAPLSLRLDQNVLFLSEMLTHNLLCRFQKKWKFFS